MTRRHDGKTPAQFAEWKREKMLRDNLEKFKRLDPVWWSRFSHLIGLFQGLQELKRPTQAHEELAKKYLMQLNAMMKDKGVTWMDVDMFPQAASMPEPLSSVK